MEQCCSESDNGLCGKGPSSCVQDILSKFMIDTLVDLSNSSLKFLVAKDQLLFAISHGLSDHQCHDSLLQNAFP